MERCAKEYEKEKQKKVLTGSALLEMDGLRVVADIELGALPSYWSASPQVRSEIRTRLEALNVRAVICTVSPIEDGWQLIPGSTYYFRFLGPHGPDNSVQSPQSPPTAATQR
jgi:hypothetical protein